MNPKVTDFLTKIKPAAQTVETVSGIPWLFIATQAAHESGYGLSELTVQANNLFGITGDTWAQQGKPVFWITTKEFGKDGTPFMIRRPFRRYESWTDSLNDWAALIERRYPVALAAARAGDFKGFAEGLQSGGYATDPKYAEQLVALHSSFGDYA